MLEVVAVAGIDEIQPGDDIAAAILDGTWEWADGTCTLADGDIVVITSKIVSKAEGQILDSADRDAVIDAESVRTVATKVTPRGTTRIVQTHHGLVLAAAGIDASNTRPGTVVLLPRDPDTAAATIGTALAERTGANVGVLITDTFGRPWRMGLTDNAIGAWNVQVLDDFTGKTDAHGRTLEMTVIALADEIASAADLVKGKVDQTPVALVRGLAHLVGSPLTAASLIRSADEDLFSLGTAEARAIGAAHAAHARRTVRDFTTDPVPHHALQIAIEAGVCAPAPHHTQPWRFALLHDQPIRTELLDAMATAWAADLAADGLDEPAIARRLARGDILRGAPALIVAFVDTSQSHRYADHRMIAERDMFIASGGAALQNIMVSLAAQGLGSAWISSSLFCPETVRTVLNQPSTCQPLGIITVGWPSEPAKPRPVMDISQYLITTSTP